MRIILFFIILSISNVSHSESFNDFENLALGFKVSKPSGWIFLTAEENIENFNQKIELNDEEFKKQVVKSFGAPLVIMTKHSDPSFNDVNPSFRVKTKPLQELRDDEPKKLLKMLLPFFKNQFNNFKLMQAPSDTEVSGLKAAYARVNYTLDATDERSFPATSELWVIPREGYYYIIGAATRQDEKTGSREEIKKILESVEITK